MTEWIAFELLRTNLVTYFTGTILGLAILVMIVFLIMLLAFGVQLRYALVFILPLIAAFSVGGWLNTISGGNFTWIFYAALMFVAMIFGFAMWKSMT